MVSSHIFIHGMHRAARWWFARSQLWCSVIFAAPIEFKLVDYLGQWNSARRAVMTSVQSYDYSIPASIPQVFPKEATLQEAIL